MHFIKIIIVVASACVAISNAKYKTRHQYIVEQFDRSAKGLDDSTIETKWFKQPLDHFNKNDTREWNMKYFENLQYWAPGGPMYIYINGEGEGTSSSLLVGIMAELAQETNGAMWGTEHRYYGESKPFQTITTQNLKYLSSQQALADIANFIQEIKQSPNFRSSKVVVVGGSYAGNLAAWMRLVYPNLVDAAIASSAPVLAKVNYYEYLETVGEVFEKYAKQECFDSINSEFERYKNLLKSETGIQVLKEEENICPDVDLNDRDNQGLFFQFKTYVYSMAAQYKFTEDIRNFCDKLDIFTDNNFNIFAGKNCISIDHRLINCDYGGIKPWIYQTCTEFGYFMTSPKNQPFAETSIEISLFLEQCSQCFGPEFTQETIEESVKRTNEMYGGLNPNLTNVIFSNGEIDPWHRLGILEDLSATVPARMIPGASHCTDLYPDNHENVKIVQQQEKTFIKKWIGH